MAIADYYWFQSPERGWAGFAPMFVAWYCFGRGLFQSPERGWAGFARLPLDYALSALDWFQSPERGWAGFAHLPGNPSGGGNPFQSPERGWAGFALTIQVSDAEAANRFNPLSGVGRVSPFHGTALPPSTKVSIP